MGEQAQGFRIQSIVAFLTIDEDGDEGVIAFKTHEGWMPAVCGDAKREALIEARVRDVIQGTGQKVRKVRFTTRVAEGWVK